PGCRFELGSNGASGEGCWVVVERKENRREVVQGAGLSWEVIGRVGKDVG
nr:hypothetical protein [Tanacetum cinerariifolium]